MRRACLMMALIFFACASPAQPAFRAYPTQVDTGEGGKVDAMVVTMGGERLTARVPHGYGAVVRADKKSVVFASSDGRIAITLKATSDSPGAMPDDDTLQRAALAANPGGTFLQISTCATGYNPAKYVDSLRTLGPSLSLKVRHAYLACPEGTVEVVCAANGSDFDTACVVFNGLMASIKVDQVKEETPTPAP